MKLAYSLLAILITLATSHSQAIGQATNETTVVAGRGSGDPGGGATTNQDGKIKTLAEAGIFFENVAHTFPDEKYPEYYEFSAAMHTELSNILKFIPKHMNIWGKRNTYIKINEINSADHAKIKSDYAQVIEAHAKNLDPAALEFVAFSKDDKTYYLPSFEALTPRQQALIQLHEYFMRANADVPIAKRLEIILKFDSYLFKLLSGDTSIYYEYLRSLIELRVLTDLDVKYLYFTKLIREVNTPIFLGHLMVDGRMNLKYNNALKIDPSLLQKYNRQIPGILGILKNSVIKNMAVIKPKTDPEAKVNEAMAQVKPLMSESSVRPYYERLKKFAIDNEAAFKTAPESNDYIIYYDEIENLTAAIEARGTNVWSFIIMSISE